MASLPRPLIGLLVATLAAFGLWYVELKPSSSSSGGSQGGVGQYQSAINQAHQAVKISGAANARLGAPTSTGPAPHSPTPAKTAAVAKPATVAKSATPAKTITKGESAGAAKATTATKASKASKASNSAASGLVPTAELVQIVQDAIREHKVLAVLFYNPAAADDRAVAAELVQVARPNPKVIGVAVPLSQLTQFGAITQQIPIVTSPTLVLIDRKDQATTLTGFADTAEISQRIDDAITGNN